MVDCRFIPWLAYVPDEYPVRRLQISEFQCNSLTVVPHHSHSKQIHIEVPALAVIGNGHGQVIDMRHGEYSVLCCSCPHCAAGKCGNGSRYCARSQRSRCSET